MFICDYVRHRLIFEKNSNFGVRDTYDRAGVWLAQKGDAFEVFDVIAGGPADAAGLKVGDRVLAVDGKNAAQLSLTDVRTRWKTAEPGTVVKLDIQNSAGGTREIKLVLKDLVQQSHWSFWAGEGILQVGVLSLCLARGVCWGRIGARVNAIRNHASQERR
jgi:carboxyl-terminal processing protease